MKIEMVQTVVTKITCHDRISANRFLEAAGTTNMNTEMKSISN